MNSMILSFLGSFFRGFREMFFQSGIAGIGRRIFSLFSNAWNHSRFVNIFHGKGKKLYNKSIVYKVLSSPFTLLKFIGIKLHSFTVKTIKTSILVDLGRCFLFPCMSLNTRFFGLMLAGASASYWAMAFASGRSSVYALAGLGAGVLLALTNRDFMGFFEHSAVVRFFMNILGFGHVHFQFYQSRDTKRKAGYVLALIVGAAGGVIGSKSLLLAAALPVGLFGVTAVLYAPIFGVFCAVFAAPFVPTMALAGLCILTAVSLVIQSFARENFSWKISSVGLGILLLLAVMLISSVFSFAPANSLMVWIMYLVLAGFFFIMINAVEHKAVLIDLLKVFAIAGALVALYGVLQYVFGWNTTNAWIDETMFEDSTMRVYSTLENPNVLGEYLLLTLPVSAAFMIYYDRKSWERYAYGAMFLVMALCLVLTQSRGCWIGFMLCVAVFVTFRNGKLWGFLPLVLAVLPFIVPQTIIDRLMSVGDMSDSSTSYRVFIWMGTLAMMRHYWIGGIGMGEAAFNSIYPMYSYNAIVAPHSHNTFLQMLVELGIGGLIVFVVTMVLFLKNCAAAYRMKDKRSIESMMALALGSGVLGFLLQSMFDYTFYNYRVMCIFFMVLAFGVILNRTMKKEYATK